jgi:uncharacterized protein (DUF427 family)
LNVIICSTSNHERTLVIVDGTVVSDSAKTLLMDEHELMDVYRRVAANVAIATLPVGAEVNYG